MPDAQQLEFADRLQKIDRNHRKLARGYEVALNEDGLIVARPRIQGLTLPYRSVFVILALLMVFKVGLFAFLGADSYQQRVDQLRAGTPIEQIGSFALKADPLTVWMAENVRRAVK